MTIFQVPNFGSVLQTYATQLFFEKLGFCCEIINYAYPNDWHYANGAKRPAKSFFRKIAVLISKKLGLHRNHRFQKKLKIFRDNNYNFTEQFKSLQSLNEHDWNDYECIIAGSDQIWNPRFVFGDSAFMLSFVPDKIKKISFASSLASDRIPDNLIKKYRSHLSRFSFIGVRENNGISIIREQLGLTCDASVILDPTLLISKDEWVDKMNLASLRKRTPYILLYILDYSFDPYPHILELTKYYSEKLQVPIKVISGKKPLLKKYLNKYEDCSASSPQEFLDLVMQADLVITSSFHGTAFAVNFGRPLIAVTPPNGDDRQSSLLRRIGLESCIVKGGQVNDDLNPFYETSAVENCLNNIRIQQTLIIKDALTQ